MAVKTAELRHEGGLRFVARTGSGFEIAMDNEIGGTAPRPTEVLAAAIGGCTAMDVVSILEKKRQQVTRYAIRVEGTQRDAHPHAFRRVDIVHEVEGPAVDVEAVRRRDRALGDAVLLRLDGLASGAAELHHRYVVISPEGAAPVEGEAVVTGPRMELPPDEAWRRWRPRAAIAVVGHRRVRRDRFAASRRPVRPVRGRPAAQTSRGTHSRCRTRARAGVGRRNDCARRDGRGPRGARAGATRCMTMRQAVYSHAHHERLRRSGSAASAARGGRARRPPSGGGGAPGRAAPRGPLDARGGPPRTRAGRADPGRDRRRHRLRRRRAGPPAHAPPERRDRRARRPRPRATSRSAGTHIHLDRTGLHVDATVPDADAVFLALPHGAAAEIVPDLVATGAAIIDLGPDFRLRDPADYPRWYGFEHPRPDLLDRRRLRPAGAPPRRARRRCATRRPRSSARPAATRPPRSSPSPRSPGPGSSATSSSTPRAASRAPAASRSRTSCSARSTRA